VRADNRRTLERFIAADPYGRQWLNPHSSIILYNGAGHFRYVILRKPGRKMMRRLYEQSPIRFWSKGI
jgi:hypothetical protein